jgi:hypothetical protein
MSKPTARVVLIVLVSLVLVVATYVTVQAAFAKAETTGAQAHLVNGLQTNFNHDRSTVSELKALEMQNQAYSEDEKPYGGGCRDHGAVPQD